MGIRRRVLCPWRTYLFVQDRYRCGILEGNPGIQGSFVAKYTDTPVKPDSEDAKYQLADGTFDQAAYDADYKQFQKDVEVYNDTVGCSVVMTVQSQIDMLVHGIVTKSK